MDNYTTTSDPTQQLNGLLGGSSGEPLIPESFITFMIICFVLLNILTIIFFIFWIMGMIRRWKVQTAVLNMQKDIAEIKQSLAPPKPISTSVEEVTQSPTPTTSDADITEKPNETPTAQS